MALGTPTTAAAYGAPKTPSAPARERVGNVAQTNSGPVNYSAGATRVNDAGSVGGSVPYQPRSVFDSIDPRMTPPPRPRSVLDTPETGTPSPYVTYGNPAPSPVPTRDYTGVGVGLAGGAAAGASSGYGLGAIGVQQGYLDDALRRIAAQYDAYGGSFAVQQELLKSMGDIERRRYTADAQALQEQINRQRQLMGGDQYRNVDLAREGNDALIAAAHDLARRQGDLLQKDWGYHLKQKDMAGSARDLALGYFDQVYGLNLEANQARFEQGNRSAMSRAAATGSYMARGYGDTLRDNEGELGRGNQSAASSRDYNRGQAGQQYERTIEGLGNEWNQRDARYQQDRADYANTLGKAERTSKYLDSLAKDYGVRAGALDDSLRQGLARLGIDHAQAIEQLNLAIAGKDTERMAQLDALMQQALSVAASAPTGTRVDPSLLGGATGGNVGAPIGGTGFTDYTSGAPTRVNQPDRIYSSGGVRRT